MPMHHEEMTVRHELLKMRVSEGHSHVSMRLAMLSTPQAHLYPSPRIRDLVQDEDFQRQLNTSPFVSPRFAPGDDFFGNLHGLAITASLAEELAPMEDPSAAVATARHVACAKPSGRRSSIDKVSKRSAGARKA